MKRDKLSRRKLLQSVGATAVAGVVGGASARVAASRQSANGGGPRTLALIGDRYHNPDYIRVSLDRLFKELGLPIDYTMNYYDLSASLLQPYQLFISLRDNMIWPDGYAAQDPMQSSGGGGRGRQERFAEWITEDQGKAVKDFVAAGNGFYSLHNNAFVSRSSKNYRDVQGGLALSHPPIRPFKVAIVNKEHPVTRGVEDFMVTDEQHYLIYDKDPKNILLKSENIDGLTFSTNYQDPAGPQNPSPAPRDLGTTSVSGWAHEFGRGRVVFTAMGHTIDAMWQPEYLKMQKNAVRWLLKQT
jgi:type 1 glutamine amidotransferase